MTQKRDLRPNVGKLAPDFDFGFGDRSKATVFGREEACIVSDV